MSIQGRLTKLSWSSQSPSCKREGFVSCLGKALVLSPREPWPSSKAGEKRHFCLETHTRWVTMTVPTRAGLFGNTTVHIPHLLQGFNNDITCLQHSLFLFISPEKTKLGLFQRAQAKIFRSSVSLILSPKLFPLLSSVAPPFSICRDKRENSIATGLHPGTEENEARQTTEK